VKVWGKWGGGVSEKGRGRAMARAPGKRVGAKPTHRKGDAPRRARHYLKRLQQGRCLFGAQTGFPNDPPPTRYLELLTGE